MTAQAPAITAFAEAFSPATLGMIAQTNAMVAERHRAMDYLGSGDFDAFDRSMATFDEIASRSPATFNKDDAR